MSYQACIIYLASLFASIPLLSLFNHEWVNIYTLGFYGALILGGFSVVGRNLSKKLKALTCALEELKNNFDKPFPLLEDKTEIGKLARVLEGQRQEVLYSPPPLDTPAPVIQEQPIIIAPQQDVSSSLVNDFKHKASDYCDLLTKLASTIQVYSSNMSLHTQSAHNNVSSVACVAEESSTSVQTVATAAEELASSIGDIGKHVSQSAHVAKRAARAAEDTDMRVNGLADAASKINDVVQLIQDIANQTHLLALNATIEAARAGEAGKGFAVVASEVKNLANQTAKATDDITRQIDQIQVATRETVTSIRSISNIIHQVNEVSDAIASAVEKQGQATESISQNLHHALQGTRQVSQRISNVTSSTNEANTTSLEIKKTIEQLSQQAELLQKSIRGLTLH